MEYAAGSNPVGPSDRAGSTPVKNTKCCQRCGEDVPVAEFSFKNKRLGSRHPVCKRCHSAYARNHYKNNAPKYKESASRSRPRQTARNKTWVHAQKAGRACLDCGGSFPAVCMDFDHIEGSAKVDSISRMMSTTVVSLKRLAEEVAKCDLVCSNCHRIRTYRRLHGAAPP